MRFRLYNLQLLLRYNYYMSTQKSPSFDSIRPQEQQYEQEIRQTYKNDLHLFINHSSDTLHLQIQDKENAGHKYKTLIAKNGYQKYDCIAEVRGSVIKYDKLRNLIENGGVQKTKLPLLLYLNAQTKYLISPKNITKYLFNNPHYRSNMGQYENQWSRKGNCYIENHFGFKLFVTASRDISPGEQLILEQRSYDNLVYSYSSSQF